MSDIKLFRFDDQHVTAIPGDARPVEKWLQKLIEGQMEAFLGVPAQARRTVGASTAWASMRTAAPSSSNPSAN